MNNFYNCRSWGAATRTKGPPHSDPGLAPPGVGQPAPTPSAVGDPPPLGPQQIPPLHVEPSTYSRGGSPHLSPPALGAPGLAAPRSGLPHVLTPQLHNWSPRT